MKEFFAKAKTFVKHNWKSALTFIACIAFIVGIYVLGELYQYLAINVWAN